MCWLSPDKDMSDSLRRMGDVEQVPKQHSSARMGGWGTGEWEGRRGWRCMLITSGAGGRALQVSVRQRTIQSRSGLALPWPVPFTLSVSSQQTQNTAHARSVKAELWTTGNTLNYVRKPLSIIHVHFDSSSCFYFCHTLNTTVTLYIKHLKSVIGFLL